MIDASKFSETYWLFYQLKALRDGGLNVSLDDLFYVVEKADHKLNAETLIERAQDVALRRKKVAA